MSTQLVKKLTTAEIVKGNLDKNREAIMKSLPRGFNYDRMCRSAINAISTTPSLAECTPTSLFLSLVKGFSLGLEPNGALSEGYLVPFNNKHNNQWIKEAQFFPSYRGLINLARRTGEIASVYAREVYKNDFFEVQEGLERKLVHKPLVFGDRGDLIGFYAVFTTKDKDVDFDIMTLKEIESIRARSKAAQSGPWVTDYIEMAKKTVIKRLLKRAPLSIELAGAIEHENKVLDGTASADIIEVEGLEIEEPPKKVSKLEKAVEEPIKESKTIEPLSVLLGKQVIPVTVDQATKFNKEVRNINIALDEIDEKHPTYAAMIRNNVNGYISNVIDYINSKN